MTLYHWPAQERPREKLLLRGAKALSDAELLAIFLRTGVQGKTAVDLARDLLQTLGSLRVLLDTDQQHLCQFRGLGKVKFVQLQAALEMGRRYLQEALYKQNALTNPSDTRAYLTAQLRGYQHEVFACLFLDAQHRPISFDELFHGTINKAIVYPREVVKRAITHNASAVIFAHNHPSGVAEPSVADKNLTDHLKKALALIDINVLDHIIIGEGSTTSLAERGLL